MIYKDSPPNTTLPPLLLLLFSIKTILAGVRWNISVVLMFIFPVAKEVVYFLIFYWTFVLLLGVLYLDHLIS